MTDQYDGAIICPNSDVVLTRDWNDDGRGGHYLGRMNVGGCSLCTEMYKKYKAKYKAPGNYFRRMTELYNAQEEDYSWW